MIHCGEIDDKFLQRLLKSESDDLTLCSAGGGVYVMAAAIDNLLGRAEAGRRLNIKGTGCIMSAAVPILAAGTYRTATPSTRFMVHECNTKLAGNSGLILAEAPEIKRIEDEYWILLGKLTKRKAAWWREQCRGRPFYFSAGKAKVWGVIDKIAT